MWSAISGSAASLTVAEQALVTTLTGTRNPASGLTISAALVNAKQPEPVLENVKVPHGVDKTQWPPANLIFPLADVSATGVTSLSPALTRDTLESQLVAALPPEPVKGALPVRLTAQARANPMTSPAFAIRCVLERPNCPTLTQPLVSEPSAAFQMAAYFDPDAPARPIRNSTVTLQVDIPNIDSTGGLNDKLNRLPQYRTLDTSQTNDVFTEPGVIDVTLPGKEALILWNNLDPLEAGVDQLPPSLDDAALSDRVITWLRIHPSTATQVEFLWMGINSVPVEQRAHVVGELLPAGTGEPDQAIALSRAPVLAQSVTVSVTANGATTPWAEIDDLTSAGPEVPVPDPRLAPGVKPYINPNNKVFMLDAEAGALRFGEGMRGSRPPEGATLRADYDYSLGAEGNVGTGSIGAAPALPPGLSVSNPIPTWGGADAETVANGEKQISRYLQHRDRLVTAADFDTIARRTPGVDIARVDVVPNYNSELAGNQPGDAAGAVTLMIVPSYDATQPDAPRPDRLFLDTICRYLDSRRLITTEVFLRGPNYRGIWISIGIKVVAGLNDAPIREAVKQAVLAYLSPFTWPLVKPVIDLEIATASGRVDGVDFVQPPILLAEGNGPAVARIDMFGLDLPRILGISVTSGAPLDLDQLRGIQTPPGGTSLGPSVVQIPVIPEECH